MEIIFERLRLSRREERVRFSWICAGVYPAAVLRGERAVPVGGAFGRGFGHRADGSTGAGDVSRERTPEALDHDGAEESEVPGTAFADLLAGIWGAGQIRIGVERPGGEGRVESADCDWAGSLGLRIGGVAIS